MLIAMRFVVLWDTELKLGMGEGDGPMRFKTLLSKWPHQRSKVIRRSNCHRNALWPPKGRTPDRVVVHYWGQRSHKSQPGVNQGSKLLRNILWQLWKEPLTEVQCIDGVKSHAGVSRGQIAQQCPMPTRFGRKNYWPESKTLLGSKYM